MIFVSSIASLSVENFDTIIPALVYSPPLNLGGVWVMMIHLS